MTRPQLVLGTRNRKKGQELLELLAPLGIDVLTLDDFPDAAQVVEDGDTFAANAAKKARVQAQRLGHWVLGEDSGLVVDALDGAPGVFSARFAGDDSDDATNNRHLLEQLAGVPDARRTAHYVCRAALSDPAGNIRAESEGRCHGCIIHNPQGSAGFGYDPLFLIPEYHRTFAQLGGAVKACLSHRARALRQLLPQLRELTRGGKWAEN